MAITSTEMDPTRDLMTNRRRTGSPSKTPTYDSASRDKITQKNPRPDEDCADGMSSASSPSDCSAIASSRSSSVRLTFSIHHCLAVELHCFSHGHATGPDDPLRGVLSRGCWHPADTWHLTNLPCRESRPSRTQRCCRSITNDI